ncbi:MAG TPA: hypothetical protein VHR86_00115 [Armatimonadota bacterium]|nr:hypothetical protein [Armatimonadota bacterium]
MARPIVRWKWVLTILIFGMVLFWAFIWPTAMQIRFQNAIRRQQMCDSARLRNALHTINDVYIETGILYPSLSGYERSFYYPYNEEYAQWTREIINPEVALHDHQFTIVLHGDTHSVTIDGYRSAGEFEKILATQKISRLPKEMETKIRMRQYVSGVQKNLQVVQQIRDAFVHRNILALTGEEDAIHRFTMKPIPRAPFRTNLPTSPAELHAYITWLSQIVGMTEIQDSWAHKVSFTFRNSKLVCHSNGRDGIHSTADDIELYSE